MYGSPYSCCQCFSTSNITILIQKGVVRLHKLHGVFLCHAGYQPAKASCTSGTLSGGFVARSKCFVVDLPKGSIVVMCYRSKKKKKNFLVSWRWGKIHSGSFSWEYTAREWCISQPSHKQLLPRVLPEWQGRWYICDTVMRDSNSMTDFHGMKQSHC